MSDSGSVSGSAPSSVSALSALIAPPLQIGPAGDPVRLGILASGNGSNFEAVAEAIASGQLNAQIQVLIYNNPEAKAAERAQRWNVPAVLLNHRAFENREALDTEIAKTLQHYQVDWVIMAGWMRIVTQTLLDAFPLRMINIHPSLLPSFKGIRAIEQALDSGVKITGCTVHLVTLDMDSGPILMQAAVPILADDDATSLHQRVQEQEHLILPAAIAHAVESA